MAMTNAEQLLVLWKLNPEKSGNLKRLKSHLVNGCPSSRKTSKRELRSTGMGQSVDDKSLSSVVSMAKQEMEEEKQEGSVRKVRLLMVFSSAGSSIHGVKSKKTMPVKRRWTSKGWWWDDGTRWRKGYVTQGYVLWLNLCQIDFQFRLLTTSHSRCFCPLVTSWATGDWPSWDFLRIIPIPTYRKLHVGQKKLRSTLIVHISLLWEMESISVPNQPKIHPWHYWMTTL